jgi:hypothetical protein
MQSFKFLIDNQELVELDSRMASWLWMQHSGFTSPENWIIQTVESNGIVNFLLGFREFTIVPINRITSHLTGRIHGPGHLMNVGWGFNIQRDPIEIQYFHYIGNAQDY